MHQNNLDHKYNHYRIWKHLDNGLTILIYLVPPLLHYVSIKCMRECECVNGHMLFFASTVSHPHPSCSSGFITSRALTYKPVLAFFSPDSYPTMLLLPVFVYLHINHVSCTKCTIHLKKISNLRKERLPSIINNSLTILTLLTNPLLYENVAFLFKPLFLWRVT